VNFFEAIVIGIVEGLTEFLPVSSTGHMILTQKLLGLDAKADPFIGSFQIIIQLGAILAVVVLYAQRFARNLEVWKRVIVAAIPTAIVGFLLNDFFENNQSNDLLTVIMLVAVGVLFLFIDRLTKSLKRYKELQDAPLSASGLVGLIQTIAVIPGVSRSGAGIIGGMLMGMDKKAAAEFSFLLAVPTMLGATVLNVAKNGLKFSSQEWGMLAVGFVVAFVVAVASIRFMMSLLPRHGFAPFGWYRIIVGLVYAAFMLRPQ
jgi:undecaprenyl-diphosphatase